MTPAASLLDPLARLALCPSCELMGPHPIQLRDATPATCDPIEIRNGMGMCVVYDGSTPACWRRDCMFCNHSWTVPYHHEGTTT